MKKITDFIKTFSITIAAGVVVFCFAMLVNQSEKTTSNNDNKPPKKTEVIPPPDNKESYEQDKPSEILTPNKKSTTPPAEETVKTVVQTNTTNSAPKEVEPANNISPDASKVNASVKKERPTAAQNNAAATTTNKEANIEVSPEFYNTGQYAVQIGLLTNNNFNLQQFGDITDLGNINSEQSSNGNKRILLGYYTNRAQADQVLSMVRDRGYKDAFIYKVPEKTIAATANTTKKATLKSGVRPNAYMVQIAALGEPKINDYKRLGTLGSLYFLYEADRDLTKVMIGPYDSQTEANEVLRELKIRGLYNAFSKQITENEAKKLEKIY